MFWDIELSSCPSGIYTPTHPHSCPLSGGAVTESDGGKVDTQFFAE